MSGQISPDLNSMEMVEREGSPSRQVEVRQDVTLQEITNECAPRMLEWMQTDVAEALGLTNEPSLERTLDWIRRAAQKQEIRAWAIHVSNVHAGNVVFDQFDRKASTARLSIYIGPPEFRGAGVGRSAIDQGLRRIFSERQLHKVWLTAHAENHAAVRTYLSLGFQVEGTLREAFVWSGRRVDALYMGLLRSEFQQ